MSLSLILQNQGENQMTGDYREPYQYPNTRWGRAVAQGARAWSDRKFERYSAIANATRMQGLKEGFAKAWEQRETIMKERWQAKRRFEGITNLTLEETARLFVINLESWAAFVFWRVVKARPGNMNAVIRFNVSRRTDNDDILALMA